MGSTQYILRHTHFYTGDDGSSHPNESQTILSIPAMPELTGWMVTLYLNSIGGNGTEESDKANAIEVVGDSDPFVSTRYSFDRWGSQRSGVAPFDYINQPILWDSVTSFWFDPSNGSPSVRLDSQNFQGFQVMDGALFSMGGTIREDWAIRGIETPHASSIPDGDGEAIPSNYWHKIGILEIAMLYVAPLDNINFFIGGLPIISANSSSDFSSGNSLILNNIYTDPSFVANFPLVPIPSIPTFVRYAPWRHIFAANLSGAGDNFGISLTDPSIWTLGGVNSINGFSYFQDPEYIVVVLGNPTLSAFLSKTYDPNSRGVHTAVLVQDEDNGTPVGDPFGQVTINGTNVISGNDFQTNLPMTHITIQPSGTVQVKRFGW